MRYRLQWGHGITAVEIAMVGRDDAPVDEASMGPRHHCRGNYIESSANIAAGGASMGPRHHCRGNGDTSIVLATGHGSLQWGHGITAVEMPSADI